MAKYRLSFCFSAEPVKTKKFVVIFFHDILSQPEGLHFGFCSVSFSFIADDVKLDIIYLVENGFYEESLRLIKEPLPYASLLQAHNSFWMYKQ